MKSNKTLATAISTHTKFTVILSAMMIFALGLDFSAYSFIVVSRSTNHTDVHIYIYTYLHAEVVFVSIQSIQ